MLEADMDEMPTIDVGGEFPETYTYVNLNIVKVARRLGRLRRTAVIMQTLESSPSHDRVVERVRDIITMQKGIIVSQITAIARREFFFVFESEEDKYSVLKRPLRFLDGKVVMWVEWQRRNTEKLVPTLKAAWVELCSIPYFLDDQAVDAGDDGMSETESPDKDEYLETQALSGQAIKIVVVSDNGGGVAD
ncbi:hypothetical protein R1sor_014283 [Riccia sorocarpa]|uniref:DUF4283 domain-containing protein n=1 Tax=Riccia sorocarpa TaxID=122646 RepID=A0ABD3HBT7_9MARC